MNSEIYDAVRLRWGDISDKQKDMIDVVIKSCEEAGKIGLAYGVGEVLALLEGLGYGKVGG